MLVRGQTPPSITHGRFPGELRTGRARILHDGAKYNTALLVPLLSPVEMA